MQLHNISRLSTDPRPPKGNIFARIGNPGGPVRTYDQDVMIGKNRVKFLSIALAGSIAVGSVVSGVQRFINNFQNDDTPSLTESYPVKLGDNAWDIAEARTTGEVRPLVDELMRQPDALDGLQPGDNLMVPPLVDTKHVDD